MKQDWEIRHLVYLLDISPTGRETTAHGIRYECIGWDDIPFGPESHIGTLTPWGFIPGPAFKGSELADIVRRRVMQWTDPGPKT